MRNNPINCHSSSHTRKEWFQSQKALHSNFGPSDFGPKDDGILQAVTPTQAQDGGGVKTVTGSDCVHYFFRRKDGRRESLPVLGPGDGTRFTPWTDHSSSVEAKKVQFSRGMNGTFCFKGTWVRCDVAHITQ